jgi:thiol-disulfide isomerase/thioredoxin
VSQGTDTPVEYTPAPWLTAEDSVVVRARFRSERDRRYHSASAAVVAGILRRNPSGDFTGTIRIPNTAVYGVFSLESADGERVDSNQRRLWDALIHGSAGLRAARQQKINDLLARNWEAAVAVQREMAEADSWDAIAWKDLFFLEEEVTPHAARDSLRAWHRQRFAELDAHYGRASSLTGGVAGELLWYARGLGDSAAESRWRGILLDRFPIAPRAVEERVAAHAANNPRAALEFLERLWQDAGDAHVFLPQSAAMLALRAGDAAAADVWLERYTRMRPETSTWAAIMLTRFAQTRDRAVAELRDRITALQRFNDDSRPLELSRSEFRRQARGEVANATFELARAVLAQGDTAEAERLLEAAAGIDWHTGALRLLATLPSTVANRADLLVRIAADPAAGFDADSARAVLGAFAEHEWGDAVALQRRRLADHVLEGTSAVPLPAGLVLADSTGAQQDVVQLTQGRPTVIAFWSPFCGPAIDLLPEIQALAQRLEVRGARLLLVTTEALDQVARSLLRSAEISIPPYVDVTGRLHAAVGQWATPEFFVFDSGLRLRFEATPISRVERQVAVLTSGH